MSQELLLLGKGRDLLELSHDVLLLVVAGAAVGIWELDGDEGPRADVAEAAADLGGLPEDPGPVAAVEPVPQPRLRPSISRAQHALSPGSLSSGLPVEAKRAARDGMRRRWAR